jgi:hypothetical protein
MDTSGLDENDRAIVELCRYQIFMQEGMWEATVVVPWGRVVVFYASRNLHFLVLLYAPMNFYFILMMHFSTGSMLELCTSLMDL